MARVKFSSIISDVSGSVGQVTFQRFYGGSMIRNKPIPRGSITEFQQSSRNFIVQVQAAWSSLTSAQQQAWSNFLSYFPQYQSRAKKVLLSGYQLFLKYNLLRLHAGLSILTSISYVPLTFQIPDYELTLDGTDLYFLFDSAFNPAVSNLLIKISPVRLNPTLTLRPRMRVVQVQSYQSGNTAWYVDQSYLAKFGVLPSIDDQVLLSFTHFSALCPIIYAPIISVISIYEA